MKGNIVMNKLKKGLMLILAALGLLLFIEKKNNISTATSIIVEANGPTSTFIAGHLKDFTPFYFIIGVPIIIALFLLRNKK